MAAPFTMAEVAWLADHLYQAVFGFEPEVHLVTLKDGTTPAVAIEAWLWLWHEPAPARWQYGLQVPQGSWTDKQTEHTLSQSGHVHYARSLLEALFRLYRYEAERLVYNRLEDLMDEQPAASTLAGRLLKDFQESYVPEPPTYYRDEDCPYTLEPPC